MATYKFGVTVRDARGQTGRVGAYVSLGATGSTYAEAGVLAGAVGNALLACTNGASIGGYGLLASVGDPASYGTNAEYPNVEDKAEITYLTSSNTLTKLSIPAPIGSGGNNVFEPDGETVNLAATNVAALTAALTAVGAHLEAPTNKAGATFVAAVSGKRIRAKFQRKVTIWTKDPTELIPEE